MFEVKVTKKTYYEISDFRGVKDPTKIEGKAKLFKRLSELGAKSSDIFQVTRELDSSRNTITIFISPAEWSKIEEAYRHES